MLDRIAESTRILEAWGDEPWVNEGAAVRVSLVCFGERKGGLLNGRTVGTIYADLTAAHVNGAALSAANLTLAKALPETAGAAYLGIQKTGPFDVPGSVARRWLALSNPHGRPNSEVVKPWFNGLDVTRRNRDFWIVDFGVSMEHDNAELFEAPFAYAREHIQPTRQSNTDASTSGQRWLFHRPRPAMREATRSLKRFIVPPEVSKHRVFAWIVHPIVPYKNLTAIAREDDRTFGVLHSRFHELWALRLGTSLEDRPRYTPTTTFETFPFPAGMTPADTAAGAPEGPLVETIATASRRLNELRENWLNPAEWVDRVPEVVPGFPDRIIPKAGHEAELKKRTLTNLYNLRLAWLDSAHKALDATVADAYGWADYTPEMPDDDILQRLLALNLSPIHRQRARLSRQEIPVCQ